MNYNEDLEAAFLEAHNDIVKKEQSYLQNEISFDELVESSINLIQKGHEVKLANQENIQN